MNRKMMTDSVIQIMPKYPDSLPVLKGLQLGTYCPQEPMPEKILKPENYPLGINIEGLPLTPIQQGTINTLVVSRKGCWLTEEDISDSFYRDTIVRKALAIASCKGMDIKDYFTYKDYTYKLNMSYRDILLYTPTIITNKGIETPEVEDIDFLQAKADFTGQYRKVKTLQEGFESYRQELLFFEHEPDYFETMEIKLKEIRKALVEDTKQKRLLSKELKELEESFASITAHHEEVMKTAKKVGKFILNRKVAKELTRIEAELADIQKKLNDLLLKLTEVSNMKSEKTAQLGILREERDKHLKARDEIGVYLEAGLVIPSTEAKIAPWNEARFNKERHLLVDKARILIKAFEKELEKQGIPWKSYEKVLTFEEFYSRMEKMKQWELGTVIVSSSISRSLGLVAGYYGTRSLLIQGVKVEGNQGVSNS